MIPSCLILVLATFALGDPPTASEIVSALESVTIDAIAKAQPSVVAIARVRGDEPDKTTAIRGIAPASVLTGLDGRPKRPFNYAPPGDFSSGVVIGADGEILTTYHTLLGSSQIWVRSADRQEFEAVILAADPRSDLAVIAPKYPAAFPLIKLTPMKLGQAGKMRPGTFLIALGNPYNAARDGKASAGWGILANTVRRIHTPDGDEGAIRTKFFRYQPTLLQLDAKLNLGMSGGAVVNMKGELVGLTTAAASPMAYDLNAGYAIPMDALGHKIANTLRQGKEVEYGFLGIGLDKESPNTVGTVGRNTPADRASLQIGDMIVAVGNRVLDEEDGLTMALAIVSVGEVVKLKIRRDGKLEDKSILVSKYPVAGQVIATNRPLPWRGLRVDYSSVLMDNAMIDVPLNAMSQGSVGIIDVEPGSSSEVAGLRKAQVISEVDGKPVANPAAFAKEVALKEGKEVMLTIQNGSGQAQIVVVPK